MTDAPLPVVLLGTWVVVAPLATTILLGVSSLLDRRLTESATTRLLQVSTVSALFATSLILVFMLINGTRHVAIELGDWVAVPGSFHFSIKFVYDRLSIPMVLLSFALGGTVGAFATRYMHRERGYNRFFVLYSLFVLGMVVASLAGTIETLFAGWELVGLSSALLVAYFQERPAPSRNALWVWVVYRVSDAALLLAAVILHHARGSGDFARLIGPNPWPEGGALLTGQQAFAVGGLLLIAAAGKSALVPFSGWLPRAMEGPTPSSAVFYGALSVHLGAYLLLRVGQLIELSVAIQTAVVVLGLATMLYAYLAGSAQTDVKSALAFASMSQVGLIVAEIGLGFRYLALAHLLGHACLRTLQFVRAPTLLNDYQAIEDAIGRHLPHDDAPWSRVIAARVQRSLYRFGLERGHLDDLLLGLVVQPFLRVFRGCDAIERRWTEFLGGGPAREGDDVKSRFGAIDEFS